MQVTDLFLGLGESLVGKTCGFLGLGKIGLATARRQQTSKILGCAKNWICCQYKIDIDQHYPFRLLPFGISRLIYTNRSQNELASEVIPTAAFFGGDVMFDIF